MADAVGRVLAQRGQAVAIGPDGAERVLRAGDQVLDGELIRTGTEGQLEIELDGGERIRMHASERWVASADAGAGVAGPMRSSASGR